jgi:hypothetical protein
VREVAIGADRVMKISTEISFAPAASRRRLGERSVYRIFGVDPK